MTHSKIYLYNTLTRKKEEFIPLVEGEVSMYACGPTVYNFVHIGNARPFILFDILRKFFQYVGYKVTYVQNITDIDDKIIARANEEGTTSEEIARKYTEAFLQDSQSLGITPPDHTPRATEYIGKMIGMLKRLVDNGYAYAVDGNVFFEASKFDEYGQLSKKDLDQSEIGERVDAEIQSQKKDSVRDFSLWKTAKTGEPSWGSPWGKGRPGWHTECAVMSTDILGDQFDIHTGGIDLVFPHHENELAQARCDGGKQFARYWLHNEFLNLKKDKMSKSLGNVISARELAEKFPKEAIRLFFLQSHYRSPIYFDYELVQSAQNAIEKIKRTLQHLENFSSENETKSDEKTVLKSIEASKQKIIDALADDFNTPGAVAEFFNIVSAINTIVHKTEASEEDKIYAVQAKNLLVDLDIIFGILPKLQERVDIDEEEIENLINQRNEFRRNKDWANADKVRDQLTDMGIVIEDRSDGYRWHVKNS